MLPTNQGSVSVAYLEIWQPGKDMAAETRSTTGRAISAICAICLSTCTPVRARTRVSDEPFKTFSKSNFLIWQIWQIWQSKSQSGFKAGISLFACHMCDMAEEVL